MKKKTILLVMVLSLLTLTVTAGVKGYAGIADDTEAEKLIDKAGYHYGLLEDYQGALKFLESALEKTNNPRIQAIALLKSAYVYWLMGKDPADFRRYIEGAIARDPTLEPEPVYYKEPFLEIFSLVKKKPKHFEEKMTEKRGQGIPREMKTREKFFIEVELDYLAPSDSHYREVYGSGKLFPRLKAGYMWGKHIYSWGAYGVLPAEGKVPGTELAAKAKQRFLSLGAGFKGPLAAKWQYKVESGILIVGLREEALDLVFSQSITGFEVEGGFIFSPVRLFFIDLSAGYSYASESAFEREFKIGGFRATVGLGIKI